MRTKEIQILKEIKQQVVKMRVEFFYKNKNSKTLPFPAVPFIVNITLPKDYKKRELRVYVLNSKADVIYSSPVPRTQKKKSNQKVTLIERNR